MRFLGKKMDTKRDTVIIYFKNNQLDYLHGIGNAIAIKQEGDAEFDQMAGKEMYAYISNGDIHIVDVQGNAETVFYPREEDGTYHGVNRTQSSFVKVFFENRTIHRVLLTSASTCVMIPMSEASDEDKHLLTFFWAEHERPLCPQDIFLTPTRTPRPDAQAKSAAAAEEEEDEEDERPNKRGKKRNKNN